MSEKKNKVKHAVENFVSSEQTTEDYMNLFYVITSATRQGDGLLWKDVEEIVDKTLQKKLI